MAVTIKRGHSTGSLSLTPLIDVVFLLVIFFLVSSRFEQEERSMKVELPQASAAQPTIFPGREVFVTVTPAGGFFVDGEQHSRDTLHSKLQQVSLENPGRQRVTIRAAADSKTSALVTVMDACNRANLRDYVVATE